MNFKVGQKVVCVNDEPGWLTGSKKLVKGTIYTIKQMCGDTDVELIECAGSSWDSSRFRPTDELTSYGINDLLEWLPFKETKTKVYQS